MRPAAAAAAASGGCNATSHVQHCPEAWLLALLLAVSAFAKSDCEETTCICCFVCLCCSSAACSLRYCSCSKSRRGSCFCSLLVITSAIRAQHYGFAFKLTAAALLLLHAPRLAVVTVVAACGSGIGQRLPKPIGKVLPAQVLLMLLMLTVSSFNPSPSREGDQAPTVTALAGPAPTAGAATPTAPAHSSTRVHRYRLTILSQVDISLLGCAAAIRAFLSNSKLPIPLLLLWHCRYDALPPNWALCQLKLFSHASYLEPVRWRGCRNRTAQTRWAANPHVPAPLPEDTPLTPANPLWIRYCCWNRH